MKQRETIFGQRALRQNQYEHGGSRICFQSLNGTQRNLMIDTYADSHFAEWMFERVADYVREHGDPTGVAD